MESLLGKTCSPSSSCCFVTSGTVLLLVYYFWCTPPQSPSSSLTVSAVLMNTNKNWILFNHKHNFTPTAIVFSSSSFLVQSSLSSKLNNVFSPYLAHGYINHHMSLSFKSASFSIFRVTIFSFLISCRGNHSP